MDELLDQFLIESRELIAQAADDFAALARDPRDVAAIDGSFRAIHTLKGSVAIFALDPAERVLHAAEDVLERARKRTLDLDPLALSVLVACLDQVDRWVDQLEQVGALASDAPVIAERLLSKVSSPTTAAKAIGAEIADAPRDLAPAPAPSHATNIIGAKQPLTAFRYAPDADCFFRGDDPLAVVAAVPDLVSLEIKPIARAWPDVSELEPFICISVFEGLSAAPLEAVRAAFRLMPDQVSLTSIAAIPEPRAESASARDAAETRTVRVDVGRLKHLADGLGEMLTAVHGLAALAASADDLDRGFAGRIREAQADLERISGNIQASLGSVRSVPIEPTLRRLPRIAREIAASTGKDVEFAITGQGIEVDRQIADGLYEPLLHLLRNAIDHGIESADRRASSGKPAMGRITLALRRDGDMIEASLIDDGAGIDPQAIRRAAIARGILDPEAPALSDAAALRLIFSPGFSTASQVTGVSGRGVGMNAVQTAVEALRGTVEVESRIGEGTSFRMRIPANALTTRLLLVEAGGDRYAVALDQVVETLRIDSDRLIPVSDGLACVLRGRTVPVLSLAGLLGAQEPPPSPVVAAGTRLLVTRAGGETVALRVDGFGERFDAQVAPAGGLLAAVPGVSGSALQSDGGVLLVLDLAELAA